MRLVLVRKGWGRGWGERGAVAKRKTASLRSNFGAPFLYVYVLFWGLNFGFGGRGKCRFYFCGRGDFSELMR